jgi:hypothetical protein
MKQLLIYTFLLFTSYWTNAQIIYSGQIDKYPIQFILDDYYNENIKAYYLYTRYDDPIELKGRLEDKKLVFEEFDKKGKKTAVIEFNNFSKTKTSIKGKWFGLTNKKPLDITLTKTSEIKSGGEYGWGEKEIISIHTLNNYYFKLSISKKRNEFLPIVTSVTVLEKKTDQIISSFKELNCQFHGIGGSLSFDDFNFDGHQDFAVFESSYAGPNTSSKYFLYNSKTQKFEHYKPLDGKISLLFDPTTKKITEVNSCCAGTKLTHIIYEISSDGKLTELETIQYTRNEEGELIKEN